MVYQYPPERPTNCPDSFYNNPDPNLVTKPYYLCMASFLPQTSVFRFKRKGNCKLKFKYAYKEKIEDSYSFNSLSYDDKKLFGYQQPCMGDSGYGHWMYDPTEKKRALVAVTSHHPFDARTGGFCGAPTHNLLTTYPSILRWIKKWSDISS